MTNEEICTKFMQDRYDDAHLAALLAHAEDGKLAFMSCCCFVGVLDADHPLRGEDQDFLSHPDVLYGSIEFDRAERSFKMLARSESERRAAIIPLIRAEMARRDALRPANPDQPVLELMAASQVNDGGDGSDHE